MAKILPFAVFTTMEFYSCEMGAFMCDQSLFSQIRSGTLFSLHIKNDSANVPNTSP